MNLNTVRALGIDAWAQVLDNKVFRVLVVLTILLLVIPLIIGFREDEMVLLFGLNTIAYEDVLPFFGGSESAAAQEDPQAFCIQQLQLLFTDFVAGTIGMMIAIAATAFFVPRMVAKGAVDTLFSKPLSRLTWYLSAFFTGVLFVGLLSTVMVSGLHLGFLIHSGYGDVSFFWSILTTVYIFALIHPITMLVGVWTRSTVAALLVALLFFVVNGAIHSGWLLKEAIVGTVDASVMESAEEGEEGEEGEEDEGGGGAALGRALLKVLDGLHFVLPKTSDSEFLTALLRSSIGGGAEFFDPDTGLEIYSLPMDLAVVDPGDATGLRVPEADALPAGELVLFATRGEGVDRDLVSLHRRERRTMSGGGDSGSRGRRESTKEAGEALVERIEAMPDAEVLEDDRTRLARQTAWEVRWKRTDGGRERTVESLAFYGWPDWIYLLQVDRPADADPDGEEDLTQAVRDSCRVILQDHTFDPSAWYGKRFTWTAELRYNALFSVGSSLGFSLLMLLLGWWKLQRTDF